MAKKKILIIDDEETFNDTVKLSLEKTGDYIVKTESNAQHGLAVTREFKPDLILLDIMMPDMDGGEVASRVKSDNSVKDTPIVFLTAAVTKEEADGQANVIGGHAFIAKPVTMEELIECVKKNAK